MIYHVTSRKEWVMQKNLGSFRAASLPTEGFIHCCSITQVEGVLQRYFIGQEDLMLLEIDEKRLVSELKYEKGGNGDLFPHIYGPIDKDAIMKIREIK
jgi:uncharacterized protein (DUF952 family)